ncbi:NAD(P)/FAD-dependent oxidoreductase [Streptomyces malaysiensis]|uniref:FAD-dependent oxidoreductase n=1 Tax=Streptomyces malaysiensis subsp. samsunensis TaxID=459658 RepID=A0A9X2RWM8_STRMQ|nr:FAD-dependent oxidoreductase [Streptomyces samsunensis]MCQ8833636.1 FAD-dependent oxidoreductase [Streptomyces samsunensis]
MCATVSPGAGNVGGRRRLCPPVPPPGRTRLPTALGAAAPKAWATPAVPTALGATRSSSGPVAHSLDVHRPSGGPIARRRGGAACLWGGEEWRLRELLRPGGRLVIVGAGFVGSEVASTAVARGVTPVVIEQAAVPLERVLGAEMGQFCADLQRANGVELHTGQAVSSVRTTADGVVVRTDGGLEVTGDAVVIAVGAQPNTDVARASGISVSNGVLVDEHCRTSIEGVYAAGDVANHRHPLYDRWLRVEHFDNANKQAMAAAKNILGGAVVYDDPHWFWSDQFGLNLQHCGDAHGWDRLVVRGSVAESDFIAFYLAGGVLRAAFTAERGGDVYAAKELIARQAAPDPRRLADEDVDLMDLMDELPEAAEAAPSGGN